LVRPVIVIGDEPPLAVNPPTFDATVYVEIVEPPLLDGAVNETVACPLPVTAVTPVGAPGIVAGVTEFDALDAVLVPCAFVAVTVKVYAVPLTRPVSVIGELPPVAVKPPVFELTVYEVIDEPPLFDGAVKLTVAWPFAATAETPVGAPGTSAGTIALLVPDGVLVPMPFVAVTVNVYVVPFVRPVIVIGDEPPEAVNPPVFELTV
jgi:hypothetical protein